MVELARIFRDESFFFTPSPLNQIIEEKGPVLAALRHEEEMNRSLIATQNEEVFCRFPFTSFFSFFSIHLIVLLLFQYEEALVIDRSRKEEEVRYSIIPGVNRLADYFSSIC